MSTTDRVERRRQLNKVRLFLRSRLEVGETVHTREALALVRTAGFTLNREEIQMVLLDPPFERAGPGVWRLAGFRSAPDA